ncbi:MAG: hypothetical protein MI746_07625, partial [Pseudomonadales bacterium]|nr:hypothetical protein [Pseudomonadales bacterium]
MALSLLWWAASLLWPSSLNGDPSPVRELLAGLGLLYLVVAAYSYYQRRSRWNSLLLMYGALTCVHWAGPLGENLGVADQVLLFLYLFFGVTLVACLFVHLALSFPNISLSFRQFIASYFPVLLTLLVIVLMVSGVLNEEGLAIVLIISSIYGFVGGMIFIYRLWFGNAVTIGRGLSLYVTMALV